MSDRESKTGEGKEACVDDKETGKGTESDGVNNSVSKTNVQGDSSSVSSKESEIESDRADEDIAKRYNLRMTTRDRGILGKSKAKKSKTKKSFHAANNDDSDEGSAISGEDYELGEIRQVRQNLESEKAALERENDELGMDKRDLRRANDALIEEVMELSRRVRSQTLEKERKKALLEEVRWLVNDIRGASDQVEQERIEVQKVIEKQERDIEKLGAIRQRKVHDKRDLEKSVRDIEKSVRDLSCDLEKAMKKKEEVEQQLEGCIGDIREAIKEREECERKEEQTASEWEANLQEFKVGEEKGRKRRLLELERTDKEFEKEITQLKQQIQVKKERVEGLRKKSLDDSVSGSNPHGSMRSSLRVGSLGKSVHSKKRSETYKKQVEESSGLSSERETGTFIKYRMNKSKSRQRDMNESDDSPSEAELSRGRKSSQRGSGKEKQKRSNADVVLKKNKDGWRASKKIVYVSNSSSGSDSEANGEGKTNRKELASRDKERNVRKKRGIRTKNSGYTSVSESGSEKESKSTNGRMKPQKFNGKGVLADFLSQFEACRDYNKWSNKEAAFQLFSCCQDDALNRLTTDGVTPRTCTYSDLVEVLEREFGPRECKSSYIMELNNVKQRPGESVRELGNRIKKLASLAFRGKDSGSKATREEMSLNSFTLALHRKDIRDVVFGAEFSNLKQAIDKAEYLESYHKRDYESEHEVPGRRRDRDKNVAFARKLEARDSKISESESEMEERIVKRLLDDINVRTLIESAGDIRKAQAAGSSSPPHGSVYRSNQPRAGPRLCYQCGDPGHMRNNCPYRLQVIPGGDAIKCQNCNSPGHGWRECGYPPLCFVCHQEGHLARDCSMTSGNERRPNQWTQGRSHNMKGQGSQEQSMNQNTSQM